MLGGRPWWSDDKASACNVGDLGSILGLGRSPGGGHGNSLQNSCLENPMDSAGVQSMEFSRPEYWSGQPFPSPGDLPNPGMEPRSPTLQADALPAGPQTSLVAQLVKDLPAMWEPGFNPWVGTILWRRERLPTPVFLPGEFHGLYSPWGCKESDTAEQLSIHFTSLSQVWFFATPWTAAF